MTNSDIRIYNKLDFWLLLAYSLLPGIGKIVGQQMIMIGALPIIIYLIFKYRYRIFFYKLDLIFIFFVCYLSLLTLIFIIFPYSNKIGVYMAVFLNILPMAGYIYSREISFENFCIILLKIILVHCVIAIILYPPFGITSSSSTIVKALTEGVAFGRMASVSGSLGFGNLIMTGMIVSFFLNKRFLPLIMFCWLFCGQRSAWLGAILGIFIVIFMGLKSGDISSSLNRLIILLIGCILMFFLIDSILDIDLDFILGRLSELGNATSERDEQWIGGIDNFTKIPIGAGPGQVGQIASRYEGGGLMNLSLVPDGDFLRILSEYGIGGAVFYISVIFLFFLSIVLIKCDLKSRVLIGILGGNLIQMIGSNISEFYFTNFIYWMVIGYFFVIIKGKLIKSKYNNENICMHGNI